MFIICVNTKQAFLEGGQEMRRGTFTSFSTVHTHTHNACDVRVEHSTPTFSGSQERKWRPGRTKEPLGAVMGSIAPLSGGRRRRFRRGSIASQQLLSRASGRASDRVNQFIWQRFKRGDTYVPNEEEERKEEERASISYVGRPRGE